MAQQRKLGGEITGEENPEIENAGLSLRRIQKQIKQLREAEEKAIEKLNAVLKGNGYGRKKYIFETIDDDTGKEIQLDCFVEKATVERARCRVHKEEKKNEQEPATAESEDDKA
jgi:hypothetical protein